MEYNIKLSNMKKSLSKIEEQYLEMAEDILLKRLEVYRNAFLSEIEFELVEELQQGSGCNSLQAKEALSPLFTEIRSEQLRYDKPPVYDGKPIINAIDKFIERCDWFIKNIESRLRERSRYTLFSIGNDDYEREDITHLAEYRNTYSIYTDVIRQLTSARFNKVLEHLPSNIPNILAMKYCKNRLLEAKKDILQLGETQALQAKKNIINTYRLYFEESLKKFQAGYGRIIDRDGSAPLPQPTPDILMGNTGEDSIIDPGDHMDKFFQETFGNCIVSKEDDREKGEGVQEPLLTERVEDPEKERLLDKLFELGVTPEEYKAAYDQRKDG